MIQVQCPGCQKRYAVPEVHAGKKMRCKQCSAVIEIPAAASMPADSPAAALPETPPAAGEAAAKASAHAGASKLSPRRPLLKKGGFGPARGKPMAPRKPLGAPAGAKRLPPRPVQPVADESVAGESTPQGASKKKLVVLIGAAVAMAVIAALVYIFFFADGPAGNRSPVGKEKGAKIAGEEKKEPAKADEKDGKEDGGEDPGASVADGKGEEPAEKTNEEAPAGPIEPLAVIPADVNLLAHVAFGQLTNIAAVQDTLKQALESGKLGDAMKEAGFDPMAHLRSIWGAVRIDSFEPLSGAPPFLVLADGMFDKAKFVEAARKHGLIGSQAKKDGAFEVFDALGDSGERFGSFTFLSDGLLALGSDDVFQAALKLTRGGEAVHSNAALKQLTGDFGSSSVVWVALDVPRAEKEKMAADAKTKKEAGVPAPIIDGGFLALDPTEAGNGVKIQATVQCPTPEDGKTLQMFVGPMLAMMKGQAPPPLHPVLNGIKLKPEGNKLHASLEISEETLAQLKDIVPMLLGAPPPGAPGGEETPAEAGGSEEEKPAGEPAMEDEKPAEDETKDEEGGEEQPAEKTGEKAGKKQEQSQQNGKKSAREEKAEPEAEEPAEEEKPGEEPPEDEKPAPDK